ncbi:hypothetical protein M231_01181 [Tremella mesenterica]|uniref:CCHC-type domain-containing protein n=1 Tax=Tremella mesenterica TaxID=5217 RepID=A0A4Q1BTR1_TREME|nr:hypothetical protein M231_01181 [Tremella mesenterica]
MLVAQAINRLDEVMKDELSRREEIGTMEELKAVVIKLDNRMTERWVERQANGQKTNWGRTPNFVQSMAKLSTTPAKNPVGAVPLSPPSRSNLVTGSQVWKQGDPLTPRPSFEQREKWRDERACLECGGQGHYVKDCPLVAAKVAQGKMNPPEMWKSSRNRGTGGNAVAVGEPRQMNAVAGEDVDEGKGLDPSV